MNKKDRKRERELLVGERERKKMMRKDSEGEERELKE